MKEFDKYKQKEFNPYIEKIKYFLKNINKTKNKEKIADFYMELEYEMPSYQGDFDKLSEDELKTNTFLCKLDDICEMTEPFSDCKKENEMLLSLMKKYGYM